MSSQIDTEKTRVHFILWNSQLWVHRLSLLAYFDKEIEVWRSRNNQDMITYVQSMRKSFASLQPENAKELKKN